MSATSGDPASAMRELRLKALTTPPSELGIKTTSDFPRIYGVVMDWPVGDQVITVVSLSDGNASLYTTSTFGIIGGFSHENVRNAAIQFVKKSDNFFDDSKITSDFSYPSKDRIKFYFMTFHGIRVIDTDKASVESGKDQYSSLFGVGQNVLSALRSVTESSK